jgi:HEAT repeat protein
VHVCQESERAARRRRRHEQAAASVPGRPPGNAPWEDLAPLLDEAIATLSEPQRLAVVGHFLEGRPQAAVAVGLGIGEDAVRKRIGTALDRLRDWFGRRGLRVGTAVLAAGLAAECPAASPALIAACTQVALQPAAAPAGVVALAAGAAPTGLLLAAAGVVALLVSGLAWLTLSPPSPLPATPPPAPLPAPAAEVAPAAAPDPLADQRLTVRFRRDHLGDIGAEVWRRTGIEVRFPPGLDFTDAISVEGDNLPLRTVLERVAAAAGLTLVVSDRAAAFWRPVDDGTWAELDRRLGDRDPAVRQAAVFDLGWLTDQRMYPRLFAVLADPDPRVAGQAVRALLDHPLAAQTAAPVPVALLARWLDDPFLAPYAAHALGRSRHPDVADLLAPMARSPDLRLRRSAAVALGSLGDRRATDLLWGMVEDGDPVVNWAVLHGLIVHQDARGLARLLSLSQGPSSEQALSLLCLSRDPLADSRLAEALVQNLPFSLWHAMVPHERLLARAQDLAATTLPREVRKVANWQQWKRWETAIDLLGTDASPRSADILAGLAVAGEHRAVKALGRTRDPRCAGLLAPLLTNPRMRDAACIGLARCGDARSVDLLMAPDALQVGDSPEMAVAGALCRSNEPRLLRRVLELWVDARHEDYWYIHSELGAGFQDPGLLPLLLARADADDDARRTAAAIQVMGGMRPPSVGAELARRAAHPNRTVRRAVVDQIARSAMRRDHHDGLRTPVDPRLLVVIERLAGDPEAAIRMRMMMVGMQDVDESWAVDLLMAALRDANPLVALAASGSLKKRWSALPQVQQALAVFSRRTDLPQSIPVPRAEPPAEPAEPRPAF